MNFSLTEDQERMREAIVRFAHAELNEGIRERDREHRFERALWTKCAEMGLLGLPVPEDYGGGGTDALSTAVALEALGYACHDSGLNFSVCAHLLACVIPIWKHGTPEQKRRYLPGLCDGTLIAANAMTETESGSDSFAMRTRAIACDGGFKITGTKTFCSNAPIADVAIVYAVTDEAKGYYGGISAFIVEKDAPGLEKGQVFEKMGLRTSSIGELVLNDVFVPDENVLGRPGGGSVIFVQSMDWERACLVACHVGTMERLLEHSIEYARTRRQHGQIIGKFQAVSHRLADMKIRLEAARLLTYRAAAQLEGSTQGSLHAAITKTFTSEALVQTALDAVHLFGGNGYMAEYDVERALRDSVASTIYSGTSEVQRNIIARWLGL